MRTWNIGFPEGFWDLNNLGYFMNILEDKNPRLLSWDLMHMLSLHPLGNIMPGYVADLLA